MPWKTGKIPWKTGKLQDPAPFPPGKAPGDVWDHRKGIKMDENWSKMFEGIPNYLVPNSLWEETWDAGERRSGIKSRNQFLSIFPFQEFPVLFPGLSHIFPSHRSCFSRLHHNQTLPAQHIGISHFSHCIPRGNDRNPSFLQEKKSIFFLPTAGKGHLWRPAPCGAIQEWDWDHSPLQVGKGFSIPAHSPCPQDSHQLPGKKKKKVGFALNPLHPQGVFQQNFPVER